MAWKETEFSLLYCIISSSELPFGAIGEEQLDDAWHPGGLCPHPTPALAVCPRWMHRGLPLNAGDPHPNSLPRTAGSGQPSKYILLS